MQRILILSDYQCDYGSYFLMNGLCGVVGDDNVVVYPFVNHYNGGIDEGYILDDGKRGFTAPCDFMMPRKLTKWTIEEIVARFNEFALVVVGVRTYAQKALAELRSKLGEKLPVPIIFVEAEDYNSLNYDALEATKPDMIFKRELFGEFTGNPVKVEGTPCYSLPFSATINKHTALPEVEKDIDVFFACGNTFELRERVVKALQAMQDIKFVGGGNEFRLCYEDFHKHIQRSKIAISVRGWGMDTVRYWEIPSHPTFMLWSRMPLMIPHPFIPHVHGDVFEPDLSDLRSKITYWLEHAEEREKIAKQGQQHLLEHHTNEARARYFLDTVENVLGVDVC